MNKFMKVGASMLVFLSISLASNAQDWDSIIKGDKTWLIERDNETERNELGKDEPFYADPIIIDGKPFDYNNFNLRTTGKLSVVRGDPRSPERTKIPFEISLRRNGVIVYPSPVPLFYKQFYSIEISEVFKYAQVNDHLIIRPVKKEHYKAKRILNLIP